MRPFVDRDPKLTVSLLLCSTATSLRTAGASRALGCALAEEEAYVLCSLSRPLRRFSADLAPSRPLSQYSGYGKGGFSRRMRVYQLSEYGERIETYKLLDSLERIDRTVLVGEDALGQ